MKIYMLDSNWLFIMDFIWVHIGLLFSGSYLLTLLVVGATTHQPMMFVVTQETKETAIAVSTKGK